MKNYTDFESIAGIDYGSKLAGSTVIVWQTNSKINILQSKKNQDADEMILDFFNSNSHIKQVFFDAPLSLPEIYSNYNRKINADFFYRQCDLEVGAMSPMFLGGLTARAIRLKHHLENRVRFFETYPGFYAKMLNLTDYGYKKDHENLIKCIEIIRQFVNQNMPPVENWHQFDACISFFAGTRFLLKQSIVFGNDNEGLIYV